MYAIRVSENKANQVSSRTQPVRSGSNLVGFFIGDSTMETLAIMAIPLTRGLYALVDEKDYEMLAKNNWYAQKVKHTHYAVRRTSQKLGKQKRIGMHRQILNAPKGYMIDHKNHCGLDNRRTNIRLCTNVQNQQNRNPNKTASSQYKGVHRQIGKIYKGKRYSGKWCARIGNNGKRIYLGLFNDEIKAAKAYDKKAKELFGEFANANF